MCTTVSTRSRTITFAIASLAPGASTTLTYPVRVADPVSAVDLVPSVLDGPGEGRADAAAAHDDEVHGRDATP